MTEELARIEKPPVENFKQGRKLYLVPLIFQGIDAPPEFMEKFTLYWQQVKEHIANLETKIGKVNRVYHELVALTGNDGLKIVEKLNPSSFQVTKEKCENGAYLEATEDNELAAESLDWEKCLLMGFTSEKVARMVSEFYIEAIKKRYEYIARKIEETLKAEEAAILFIREGHRVQFSKDILVFSVSPPALDQIHRWLRDQPVAKEEGEGNKSD